MNISVKEPVYIIIPVHNRKNITLKCLETLSQTGDLQRYHVIVVDDGSTDGTTEAINSLYPDITILAGDGNLWWTGAIKKGMEYAYEQGAEYFVWLNDDCYPQKNSISKLLDICRFDCKSIVGGQSLDPDTLEPSYGGIAVKKYRIEPVNALQGSLAECDGLAGNFICFSRKVVEAVGYPNADIFPQYYGDVTYTHAAKNKGYILLVNGEATAFCKNDHPCISWITPNRFLLDYWQEYFIIKSSYYWKADINCHKFFWDIPGVFLYFYRKIIKFWLIFFFIYPLPLNFRQKIKQGFTNHLRK